MLSNSSIHIGHRPNLSLPPRSAFSPSSTGRRCNICSKPNWSIKISAEKKTQNTRSQLRSQLTKARYRSCGKGRGYGFVLPFLRAECMFACCSACSELMPRCHNENRWNSLANRKMQLCSPKKIQSVEANTVSEWQIHLPSPEKKKSTFIPVILIISDIWHKVWTYTSATSKKKLTFLLAFIPALQATQLIDGVMKNDSHHVHQQRIQWGFFGLLKNAPKTVEVRILSRCFDVTHVLQMG